MTSAYPLQVTAATVELSPVPRVVITTTGSAGSLIRTNADGTKERVRMIGPAGGNPSWTWYDYEAPQGTTVAYKGDDPSSTSTASAAVPSLQPWLICPNFPTDSVPLTIAAGGFTGWARPATVSTVQVIGSSTPYSVDMARQDASGQLAILSIDDATQQALRAAVGHPGPKLLSWALDSWKAGTARWVFVSDFTEVPGVAQASPVWTTTLTLVPTSRPVVAFGDQATGVMTGKAWTDLSADAWSNLAGWTWQ